VGSFLAEEQDARRINEVVMTLADAGPHHPLGRKRRLVADPDPAKMLRVAPNCQRSGGSNLAMRMSEQIP
jgi:hypothetical protein